MLLLSTIHLSWVQDFVALVLVVLACVVSIVFVALFAQKVSRWSLWKLAPSTLAVLVLLSGVTTDLAQKAGGDRGIENGELGGGPRSLPPELASASNLIAILNFVPDPPNKEIAFEVACSNILFDHSASRNLYLFSSTNLLEPRWTPLGAFAMPADTNIFAFAVTTNDVEAVALPGFLDTMNGIAFFRFAADIDSDGDGLIDSYETLCSFTDPELADTDGDGLLDGQELFEEIGTDPLLPDTDGDGVSDGDEVVAGTSPLSTDTDGDGLSDAQELGAMTAMIEEDFMWMDVVDATPLVEWEYAYGDNWVVPLIRDVVINGVCYTNAKIHVDGTVQLLCPTNIWDWGYASNYGFLSNTQYAASHVTVAVCGVRLYAQTNEWQSQIFHGTASRGGRDYTVVEYRNIGLAEYADTNELITCQLILPHDETNTVYVSYLCVSNLFRETDFIVGVQCGWMRSWKPGERYYNLSWSLTVGFPQDGLTIKYSIGTGTAPSRPDTDFDGLLDAEEVLTTQTSPVVADMDGDGLFDGEEMAFGTDPMNADTDSDGMPDGWEVQNGLDPLADDAAGDINVRHALDTAQNFSVAANALPGTKVMLAHSLGNMIVSEAAKYHLLDYQKYYMLNAAVPMEAYDAGASAQEMIEHGWSDVDSSKWAANWYECISDSGDPRQTLKWRGRFAGIHDAINCYSPTEDILANASMNGWGGLWGAQELFKGTATLHFIPGNCEGGWGYNSEHTNLAGLLTDFAKTNEFTDAELIASPIFRKFDNALLHQTNLISIAQTELNKVMGDGIPATSFAAGRNPIENNCVLRNVQLVPEDMTCWPRERIEDGQCKWRHSDIREVAFFYVNHIFRMIITGD